VHVAPRALRPSRFHPLADGLAIAGYLGRGGVRRWGAEAAAAALEVGAVFTRERREARHARMLGRASIHAGTPAWSAAVGMAALDEVRGRARAWWHHVRARRARRAALATVASPVLLAVAAATVRRGGELPRALEQLVRRVYDPVALPPLPEHGGAHPVEGEQAWATAAP
jgi:hypothetical protein